MRFIATRTSQAPSIDQSPHDLAYRVIPPLVSKTGLTRHWEIDIPSIGALVELLSTGFVVLSNDVDFGPSIEFYDDWREGYGT